MGQLKQLHIDCEINECRVDQPETCYMIERVSDAEIEKARRAYELSKYSKTELLAELNSRGVRAFQSTKKVK